MKHWVIRFEEAGVAALSCHEMPPLADDKVLVENAYTVISAGTERANFLGLPNTVSHEHGFPHAVGYSGAGRVVGVGRDVEGIKTGQRVVVAWGGHCSHSIKKASDLVLIEDDDIDLLDASFATIATFPLLAIRRLQIQLGESVVIVGMGLLGAFAVQFAQLSGAHPVVAVDPDPARRRLALELGASAAFSPDDPDLIAGITTACDGRGPDAVVEATGVAVALRQALEYIAFRGRIALLGCTRVSDVQIDFYKHVHKRGVSLIGAHTFARPKHESSPEAWTEADDVRTFLKLNAAGKVTCRPFVSEVVSPQRAPAVYRRLADAEAIPLGIVFDWAQLGGGRS